MQRAASVYMLSGGVRDERYIDLVALNEEARVVRLGSCKRSPERLVRDLSKFDGHVERFIGAFGRFKGRKVEKVADGPSELAGLPGPDHAWR